MVRRDASGVTEMALKDAVRQGRALVVWCAAVSDESSFECWRGARLRWTRRTCRILCEQFDAETVEEFLRADTTATAPWERSQRADLRAMENAIELLVLLSSTMRG
jgi:hypothetical protein